MRKSWLLCVLLGTLAWGQAPGTPPPAQRPTPPAPGSAQAPAPTDDSASVAADAPVLTIKGVCAPKTAAAKTAMTAKGSTPAAKTPAADCKTVITKAQFERLASGVAPNMTPQLKRQLASVLPRLMAMSQAAEKKGIDKSPRFIETMKFARMQILTNELQKSIQEDAAKVPDADIEAYYNKNPSAYEQYNLDRLFVPRNKQQADDGKEEADDSKLTEEQQKAKEAEEKTRADQGEQEMTKLADALRERAAKGEDFLTLQKEAFAAGGLKIDSPTVNLAKIRRTGLPPTHSAVFDLKNGEVSQVISDSGGHYIYKLNSKEQLPLSAVKDEVHNTLQGQRTKEGTEKYTTSFQVESNEQYFGPAGPAGMHPVQPPHLPKPHMAPSPIVPTPASPAQPPAAQPNN